MSTQARHDLDLPTDRTRRLSTETKASTKTTEFFMYLAAVSAIVITAFVVGDDGKGTADPFSALDAMRYITYLTIGYMVARGILLSWTRIQGPDAPAEPARGAGPVLTGAGETFALLTDR